MAAKLPMTVRKSLRDEFEAKLPELESKISSILGVPWTIKVDANTIFLDATERYAKESLGPMLFEYFNRAAENLEIYVQRYEDDGKTTLNHLASTHQVTIAKDTEKKHGTCGCDVKDGQLRILFGDKCLGFNTSDATEVDRLGKAVNDAEAAGGASALNLDARNSISKEYDTEIGETLEKARKSLNLPTLKFAPDFEHNFAELTKIGDKASRDWAKSLGSTSLSYYNGFVDQLERQKFVGDDMLQEGFAESVSKGEVGLRIVPKLVKGSYNEVVIDDGVCYIQTTPDNWACNTNDAAEGLLDLL